MTVETLQSLAAAEADPLGYWSWRLKVALVNQEPITILPVPHCPGDVGRRGWPFRHNSITG